LHQVPALLFELVEQLLAVAVVDLRGLGEGCLADVLGRRQIAGKEGERGQPTGDRQTDESDQESDQERREDRRFRAESALPGLGLPIRSSTERMIACRGAWNASILD